jgi:hypothetical protein
MSIPVQQHMPRRRSGHTTAVTIGGEQVYLTANQREDGTLGEVFIQWGKQGTTGAGLMDIYAIALSVGLQHQVPLPDLIRPGLDLYFVPNGHTDDPEIPRVRSVIDYIARRLANDWLPARTRARSRRADADRSVLWCGGGSCGTGSGGIAETMACADDPVPDGVPFFLLGRMFRDGR